MKENESGVRGVRDVSQRSVCEGEREESVELERVSNVVSESEN